MAQGVLCGCRAAGSVFAGSECRDSILFGAERFGLCDKHGAQAFGAGAGPAAADEERGELDSSRGSHCRLRIAELVSPYFTRRAANAQRFA